jgi:hypothetical protein
MYPAKPAATMRQAMPNQCTSVRQPSRGGGASVGADALVFRPSFRTWVMP